MTVQAEGTRCQPSAPHGFRARYAYHRPRSWEELFDLMDDTPGARLIAGGTDLMVRIRQKTIHPEALLSLRAMADLRGIDMGPPIRIGAATPIADIASHPGLQLAAAVLVEAAGRLGSAQIRNVGTVGGNLGNASPCADMAPALGVLDARLVLRGRSGMREVPISSFFIGPGQTCLLPGEVLSQVVIDPIAGAQGRFMKKSRVAMDLAMASVAVLLRCTGDKCTHVRVVAGAVGPTPLRLERVESLVLGQTIGEEVLQEAQRTAAREVSPITDVRATEGYRREVVGVYVKRALRELAGRQA